jgi:hypothetical protein
MLQAASLAFSIAFSRTLLFAEANDYLEFYLFQSASTHAIGGYVLRVRCLLTEAAAF